MIHRALAQEQPDRYRPHLANTTSNLGNALSDLRKFSEARQMFEESLAIYEELCATQPGIYRPDVGRVLNNLGVALHDLRELEGARDAL